MLKKSGSEITTLSHTLLIKIKGLICFEPLNVGSTKVKVQGKRYELDRYGKQKSSEPFYRAFKVRIRPQKESGTGGTFY